MYMKLAYLVLIYAADVIQLRFPSCTHNILNVKGEWCTISYCPVQAVHECSMDK